MECQLEKEGREDMRGMERPGIGRPNGAEEFFEGMSDKGRR